MNNWIKHSLLFILYTLSFSLFGTIIPYYVNKEVIREEIAANSRIKPCYPGVQGCKTLVIPFQYDELDKPYINITIDDKKFHALIDTGASRTLIDSKSTGVTGSKDTLRDFHGDVITVDEASMKICIESICSYENVDVVPHLIGPAILRGSFFDRFHTAKFDYYARTITLEGWQ